jgi:hypothetical protein
LPDALKLNDRFRSERLSSSGVILLRFTSTFLLAPLVKTMLQNSRLGPPQKMLRIRNLAEQGCSAVEIAKLIDSTPGSVRVFCSHHKIKIRRSRRYLRSALPRHIQSPSDHTIVARMPARLYFDFHRKAEHLQMPVSVLASNLLTAIASSNIYEAVLDDEDKDGRRGADIAA